MKLESTPKIAIKALYSTPPPIDPPTMYTCTTD